jgi:hypothetical protein
MKFISFYIIFFLKKWECEIDPAVHKLIYKKIDIDMAVSLSHKKKKKKVFTIHKTSSLTKVGIRSLHSLSASVFVKNPFLCRRPHFKAQRFLSFPLSHTNRYPFECMIKIELKWTKLDSNSMKGFSH